MSASPTVFISAGESSGDLHGAGLAESLRELVPGVRLLGLGGSRMKAAGVRLLADLDQLAVLGLVEVVRHLPALLRIRREVYRSLEAEGVDLVVPIDYPGFNLPLAGRAHRLGIPVVYYVAPQVWAGKEKRARRLALWCDEICVVLPFEEDLLHRYGANVRFVGHPLLDQARPDIGASREEVLGLFPGSRRQELERLLPDFLETARMLLDRRPDLRILVARAPDLPAGLFADCPGKWLADPETVLARSRAALTKSGTVTLQLALADVPMVVAYRVHPVTWHLLRRLVSVDHVALVNLVAGHTVVPERLQQEMTPDRLAEDLAPLLEQGAERERVRAGLAQVRGALGEPGASRRVAEVCVEHLRQSGAV